MSGETSEVSSSALDLPKKQVRKTPLRILSLRQAVRNKKPDVGVLLLEEFVREQQEDDSGSE